MGNRTTFITLIALSLIFLVTTAGCNVKGPKNIKIEEFSIPVEGRIIKLAVSGSDIVLLAEITSHESGISYTYKLNHYNLETDFQETLTTIGNVGNTWYFNLDIGGDFVVWKESTEKTGDDIWGYNLATREKFVINNEPGNQRFPYIVGDHVLYRGEEKYETRTHWTYHLYNLTTGETLAVDITSNAHLSYLPLFEDDFPAWEYMPWIYYESLGYDPSVVTDGRTIIWLDNSPTTPLWEDGRAGDIVAYNYDQQTEIRLPRTWAYVGEYAVSGNFVVWTEGGKRQYHDIFGYDIASGSRFPIFQGDTWVGNVAMDDGVVIWVGVVNYVHFLHGVRITRSSP